MNVKRFTAKSSREALRLVREALGADAVVLSTKPSAGGVEVLAMAPDSIGHLEQMATSAHDTTATATTAARVAGELAHSSAEQDAERLEMSTLSFQDYVRKRMLKRRQASLDGGNATLPSHGIDSSAHAGSGATPPARLDVRLDDSLELPTSAAEAAPMRDDTIVVRGVVARPAAAVSAAAAAAATEPRQRDSDFQVDGQGQRDTDLLAELRSVKGLIEERFGALAFMERLQRRPAEARLTQKLLDCGFSPVLVRKIAAGLKADTADEAAWAAQILERNLQGAEAGAAIEDRGGVFAMIGATGVGKTTSTAKIAAAFAARHGAANLGLITLDAYRVGAHEQLRAYGRILGVPVHTAHDRASLEDLLELLSAKKLILIDTAGMAQRDARTRDLLEMISHPSIQRLLVVSAAAQAETIEDVLIAYRAPTCVGMVLSKLDEAVKLGPALDAAIRHKLGIVGVANGQRVPEDWHRLSANALVQRAMRSTGSAAWRLDAAEMSLVFAATQGVPESAVAA
ncbi:MAG: flagellar biosynthesis protein FlhF [Caldimonas sp.]